MADQLYLSYVLPGFNEKNMLRQYEKLLRAFPYSRLSQGGAILRINAISSVEPPLIERAFEDPTGEGDQIMSAVREFAASDCGFFLESSWDLWQFSGGDWKLLPARVTLSCFGPQFESEAEDNIRVEFGIDTHFLPQPDLPNYLFMSRSNVRSLLHLVHELDNQFASGTRRLWTESGDNFAERLQNALREDSSS